jgi:hypothetical protein
MLMEKIGYHVRDFFLKKWDYYKGYPLMVLAHSTLLKPDGTYQEGKEHPRINATLATGIHHLVCRKINLNYYTPLEINPRNPIGEQNEDMLVVRNAGEILYRFRDN